MRKIVVRGSTTAWGSGRHAPGALHGFLHESHRKHAGTFHALYESGAAGRVQHATDSARTGIRARCAGDSYTLGASAGRLPNAARLPDEVHSGGETGWCAPPEHAADTELTAQRTACKHRAALGLMVRIADLSLHAWRVRAHTRTGVARDGRLFSAWGIFPLAPVGDKSVFIN